MSQWQSQPASSQEGPMSHAMPNSNYQTQGGRSREAGGEGNGSSSEVGKGHAWKAGKGA